MILLDWWQLGWLLAGLFFVMFIAAAASRGQTEKGWHQRQHWETDMIAKGKLERQ